MAREFLAGESSRVKQEEVKERIALRATELLEQKPVYELAKRRLERMQKNLEELQSGDDETAVFTTLDGKRKRQEYISEMAAHLQEAEQALKKSKNIH